MKKLPLLLFSALFLAGACKQKNTSEKTTGKETVATDSAKDSAEIRQTVTDFYTWYTGNYSRFDRFDLYSGTKKANEPPYKINWDVVDKYQAFIRDSVPHLGAGFLENQRLLFKKADSAFKVDVEDDVPYYFDYDWYTNTQEDPQVLLDEINKSKQWIISVKGDDATVDIRGYDDNGKQAPVTVINLRMKRENGKWTIAKIGND